MRRLFPLLLVLVVLLAGDPLVPARAEFACVADSLLARWGLPTRCTEAGIVDAAPAENLPSTRNRGAPGSRSAAVEDSIANLLAALAERATPALVAPSAHPVQGAGRLPYPDALPERKLASGATIDEDDPPVAATETMVAPAQPAGLRLTTVPHPADPDESQRLLEQHYPEHLRQSGVGGTVVLALAIDARGRVREQQVVSGSGDAALDAAAVDVARRLRFTPAQEGGRRVATRIVFPFVFNP